jgi:hypothetical protein
MKIIHIFVLTISLANCFVGDAVNSCLAQEPYKGGVQENVPGQSESYSYPAPKMIPVPAQSAPPPRRTPAYSGSASQSQFSGSASQSTNTRPPETFSANVTRVALPPIFLGAWQVHGERTNVEALPEFQAAANQAFTMSNNQVWNIAGNPNNGYTLGSDTGINTALYVDKVQGNTAFVRYQHPVGKTMAQEAIVMSLAQGGLQFDGLERISIVKEGLPQPRAKVTYRLTGVRRQ